MKLPVKNDQPIFSLTLPSTGKKLRFRPFIKKEEKILLMALESKNSQDILDAMKQVISNCFIDGDIDVENMPVFDIEFIFLHLRAQSVGEMIESRYRCDNVIQNDDGSMSSCENVMKLSINIKDVKVSNLDKSKTLLTLSDNLQLKMLYPRVNIINLAQESEQKNIDLENRVIIDCIEYIVQDDNVYYAKDYSDEDLNEFLESLNKKQFSEIETFFQNLPYLSKDVECFCDKCGFKHNIKIEGYENFFV